MNLKIIKPQIFTKDKIIAGVTERNQHIHPIGFSFCAVDSIDAQTAQSHREMLAKNLGVDVDDFFYLRQIHSDKVSIVDEKFEPNEGDALITNIKGKILVVKIADCAGVLIYDPINEVVGAIHSGWRGSSLKIVPKTIEKMAKKYGSDPRNLLVYISPLASGKRYEVGEDVAKLFPLSTIPTPNGKYFFDNRKEIIYQLKETGVEEKNIEYSPLCTISNTNLHSYRRDKEKSGRMAAFIGLKK
ncbi:MAG: peptidoglycan editing factor PgeF [Candidatus Kapaibacteriota bacterium]